MGIIFTAPAISRAQYSTAELSSGENRVDWSASAVWLLRGWVNSEPMKVEQLRGKVLLIRFFDDQPIGATAVRQFADGYKSQG
jgi:hypothetical protein